MVVEAASLVVVDQCRPDTRHKHRTCRSQGYSRSSRPEGRELRSTQMEGTPGIGSSIGSSRQARVTAVVKAVKAAAVKEKVGQGSAVEAARALAVRGVGMAAAVEGPGSQLERWVGAEAVVERVGAVQAAAEGVAAAMLHSSVGTADMARRTIACAYCPGSKRCSRYSCQHTHTESVAPAKVAAVKEKVGRVWVAVEAMARAARAKETAVAAVPEEHRWAVREWAKAVEAVETISCSNCCQCAPSWRLERCRSRCSLAASERTWQVSKSCQKQRRPTASSAPCQCSLCMPCRAH